MKPRQRIRAGPDEASGRPPAAAPARNAAREYFEAHPAHLPAAAALLVFLPSLWSGFVYDDLQLLLGRGTLDISDLPRALRYDVARPFLSLTWALSYAFGGAAAWHFHLANVLLHAANSVLVFRLLAWIERRRAPAAGDRLPLLAACLFAITPMAVETAAYVSSRSTALASLLILLALLQALELFDRPTGRRLLAALGFFVLALLTKEEAASLPLYLLLLDAFFVSPGGARTLRLRVHAPFLLLAAAALVARRAVAGAWLPAPPIPTSQYLLTQAVWFPGYLLRALLPLDPALYRGVSPASWPPDPASALLLLAGVGIAVSVVRGGRRWQFAVCWLVAGLLPSSSIAVLEEMVVDHRAYLGSAGLLLVLGSFLLPRGRLAIALALALLAARTVQYQRVLAQPVTAWQDAVARAPRSPLAHRALAQALAEAGDQAAALQEFREAVRVAPGDYKSWTNLGTYCHAAGLLAEAEQAMRQAIALDPAQGQLLDNLGMILRDLGREDEAIQAFEQAIERSPGLAQPRISLATHLMARGERERVQRLLDQASRLHLEPHELEGYSMLRQWLDAHPDPQVP